MIRPWSPPGETPLTDNFLEGENPDMMSWPEFARQLERELRQAQERCAELEKVLATARIHIANRGAFRSHVDMLYAIDTALTDAAASGPKEVKP